MKQLQLLGLLPMAAIAGALCAPAPDAADSTREPGTEGPVTRAIRMTDAQTGGISTQVRTSVTTGPPTPARTLSLQIPDFRPAHADDRRYYIVEFSGRSSNVAPAVANSEGVLTARFPDYGLPQALAQPAETEQRHWFFSVHQDTGQLLFTLDLTDVPLVALVNSLAMALDRSPADQMLQPPGSRGRTSAEGVMLKIRGNHMTLRETFDLIYQQTGCSVFREQGRLLMTVCE